LNDEDYYNKNNGFVLFSINFGCGSQICINPLIDILDAFLMCAAMVNFSLIAV